MLSRLGQAKEGRGAAAATAATAAAAAAAAELRHAGGCSWR